MIGVRAAQDATLAMARLGLYTEPTCAQAAAAYLQRCRDLAPWLSPLALSACERMLAGWNRTRH